MTGWGQDYINVGVLKSLKLWLDPLDDKKKAASLPNKTLITKARPAPHPAAQTMAPISPARAWRRCSLAGACGPEPGGRGMGEVGAAGAGGAGPDAGGQRAQAGDAGPGVQVRAGPRHRERGHAPTYQRWSRPSCQRWSRPCLSSVVTSLPVSNGHAPACERWSRPCLSAVVTSLPVSGGHVPLSTPRAQRAPAHPSRLPGHVPSPASAWPVRAGIRC
jgi:hypothetical protein